MRSKDDERTSPALHTPFSELPAPAWVDRGWWLAIEYGVAASRERFLRKLPKLRSFGKMRELLEPGGRIVYRNLFREDQVREAWQLLCELSPWKSQLSIYLNGEPISVRDASDVLWCAGFLRKERPCRPKLEPAKKKDDRAAAWLLGCGDRRVSLAPSGFDERDPARRHALTFASVDERGLLRFDRDAIAAFFAEGERGLRCPLSPARDPAKLALAFEDVSVRALGWPLVLEVTPEVRARLGDAALEAEHGFVLKRGAGELEEHEPIELRLPRRDDARVEVRRVADLRTGSIAREVRVAKRVRDALADGARLRGVRIEGGFVRGPDGRYEDEERFVLSTRFHLGPADDPRNYEGFRPGTVPRATDEYLAWVGAVIEAIP